MGLGRAGEEAEVDASSRSTAAAAAAAAAVISPGWRAG